MKLATVGVGNAGSKIVDRMLEFEHDTSRNLCRHAIAINTARTDLAHPDHIPESRRVLIGQTHQQVKGHGVGGDTDLGAQVAEDDMDEIMRSLDDIAVHDVDAMLVVAGLGGGTGSGAGPVLIQQLREMYNEPVYSLGVLPGTYEGGRPALNAARSLSSFVNYSDNFIAFDNDSWRETGQSVEQGYEQTNRELATRIVTLLAAGELDDSSVAENAMDSSDIIRTLATGGVSSIAYAANEPNLKNAGLLGRFRDGEEDHDNAAEVQSLVRRAVHSRMTLPCSVESAERALIVVSGPPTEISRKGLESSRNWLEQEADTVEVLAGDDPRRSQTIAAAVLLSNIGDASRIDQMQEQAVDAQEKIEELEAERDEKINNLITDSEGDLDPVV